MFTLTISQERVGVMMSKDYKGIMNWHQEIVFLMMTYTGWPNIKVIPSVTGNHTARVKHDGHTMELIKFNIQA
jgi:hypothetical protein